MNETWDKMLEAIRSGEPVAISVSPELYYEQCEFIQGVNSAYVSSEPESLRLPWLGIEGLPVIIDPNLPPDTFALVNSRDFIDDMRIAMGIYTDGMMEDAVHYKVAVGLVNE